MTPEQETIIRDHDSRDLDRIAEWLDRGDEFRAWLAEKPADRKGLGGELIPGEWVGTAKEPGWNPLSLWLRERTGRLPMLSSAGTFRCLASDQERRLTGWAKRFEAQLSQEADHRPLTATMALEVLDRCLALEQQAKELVTA